MVYTRVTNASDNNKPIIGVLDNNQLDKINKFYDECDYELTPKKKVIWGVRIVLICLITFWTVYNALFVLDFSKISAKSLSTREVNISSNNVLSFELKSNDYYIYDNYYMLTTEGSVGDVLYITVKKPIISKKKSQKQMKTDLTYQKYEINVESISAVYYRGKGVNDKFLIWER